MKFCKIEEKTIMCSHCGKEIILKPTMFKFNSSHDVNCPHCNEIINYNYLSENDKNKISEMKLLLTQKLTNL